MSSASAIVADVGADFISYGPMEDADIVFPAVAMANAALASPLFFDGGR